jgi:hypothetical protein
MAETRGVTDPELAENLSDFYRKSAKIAVCFSLRGRNARLQSMGRK